MVSPLTLPLFSRGAEWGAADVDLVGAGGVEDAVEKEAERVVAGHVEVMRRGGGDVD